MQHTLRSRKLDYVWRMALISAIGLFLVNIAGFIDTETGSALGCGHQWPLCNSSVVPGAWSTHTIIEFAHRALVGGVTLFLIVTSILTWRKYRDWLEVKVLISVMMGFVFLEAFLGALGVLVGDPPAVLAIHLGVSLVAFAAVILLTIVIAQVQRAIQTAPQAPKLRAGKLPKHFGMWVFISLIYTFGALYVGAFIASIGAGGSFRGFPFPTESYQMAGKNLYFDILHRSIALGLLALCVGLFVAGYRFRHQRRDLYRGTLTALILVCLQGLSGGLLVYTHLSKPAFLLHVSIVSGLFATLAYLCLEVLPEPSREATLAGTRVKVLERNARQVVK